MGRICISQHMGSWQSLLDKHAITAIAKKRQQATKAIWIYIRMVLVFWCWYFAYFASSHFQLDDIPLAVDMYQPRQSLDIFVSPSLGHPITIIPGYH